jgi:FAD/FMN-containing dehydrogenase
MSMIDLIEKTIRQLGDQLPGRVSRPGDAAYAAATSIWAKQIERAPRAVVHCRTAEDVQSAIRAARVSRIALSVRGGGHDWAGRALCDGLVIDLSAMNDVSIEADNCTARILGGARATDVLAMTDPRGLAAATGSCGAVGMTGLTLGGGYGPLIGRFGLALDNLVAAEVVLADGRIVTASPDSEDELFWALRGGGGNFGVVTAMRHRLYDLPSVRAGMLVFPFAQARTVLQGCVDIAASAPEELSIQLGCAFGAEGAPVVMVIPTWSGAPQQGEARIAPFLKLGTLLIDTVDVMTCGRLLKVFDPFIVNGQRVFMETIWLAALDARAIDAMLHAMTTAASAGCAVFTHEFRGLASRIPVEATAFGLRRDHILIELIACFADQSAPIEQQRHRRWVRAARQKFEPMALPGGYPNLLPPGDMERAAKSYGRNAERLMRAKRQYDPDNIFRSAIPLPADEKPGSARMQSGSSAGGS